MSGGSPGPRARKSGTIIALHGFTGNRKSFAPLQLEDLGFSLHVPLLSGHGPDPDRSAEEFDDELERLIVRIDELPEPRHLLGYSMGARVGLGLCVRYPEVFSSATLVGVNPGLETDDAREERHAWEAAWIGVLEQDGLAVFEHHWSRLPIFASQNTAPPKLRAAQQAARLSHTATGLAQALRVLGLASMPDYWSHLSLVPFPVSLVVGTLDNKFHAIADRAVDLLLDGHLVEIDGVGHNPLVEAPLAVRQVVAQTIEHAPLGPREGEVLP